MLYKLQDGKLITPPTVWKGVIGYNNDLKRLTADGWKPLIVSGIGSEIELVEHSDYIEELHSEPPYDYRAERRKMYPELGDVIDAILKAYDGDDEELKMIQMHRQAVKANIRKSDDAD